MNKISQLFRNALRLNAIAWENRKSFIIFTVFFSLLTAVIPYASSGVNALLVNHLTATFGSGVLGDKLIFLAIASALLLFVPDMISSIATWVDKRIWIDIGQVIQLKFFHKKGEIDIQTYEDPKFLDILNKAEDRGIWPATNFLATQFMALGNLVGVIIGLVILFLFDWRICILVVIAIIPQFLVELKYNDDTWGIWSADTATRRKYNHLQSHFEQKNWLIELKLFQNVSFFYKKIEAILVSFNNKQRKVEYKKLFFQISATFVTGGIIAGVTFWIIVNVVNGKTEIGTMLFLITSITQLQSSLIRFMDRVVGLDEYSLYTSDIFHVLETKTVLTRSTNPVSLNTNLTPEITFENVSFSYPQSDTLTLKNVSLTIRKGEKFALVGENGAGKTTFVKLLCRIYDPSSGRILVDGTDLREIDLDSWYRILGILLQEYAPYKFGVKEVIALGRSDDAFDMERIESAAVASESNSFIKDWADKYDQQLGIEFDKGLDPSKGQQQRLAIARLLYRKAGILILDEPTASIDAEAEKKILEQIEKSTLHQTVILISHKYSTVKNADRICVFKDKSVHELGSHDELMKMNGTYARLFNDQAQGYN